MLRDRIVALQDQAINASASHVAVNLVSVGVQVVSAKSANTTLSAQLAQQQVINDSNQSLLSRCVVASIWLYSQTHIHQVASACRLQC